MIYTFCKKCHKKIKLDEEIVAIYKEVNSEGPGLCSYCNNNKDNLGTNVFMFHKKCFTVIAGKNFFEEFK